MPTLESFINTNPNDIGNGNANLLISSSAVNPPANQTPVPPYYIQGLTVPVVSKNNIQVRSALLQANELRFTFSGDIKIAPIVDRQIFTDYVYLEINPLASTTLPDSIGSLQKNQDEEFIFIPFFQSNFFNDDYNVLINNNERTRRSTIRQVVDRNTSQANPTNLDLLISQTGTTATVQDSNYTQRSRIQGRYLGAKLDSKGIRGQEPIVQLTQFKGSIHPLTSVVGNIKNLEPADRTEVDIFFTSYISASNGYFSAASFPKSGSFIFTEVENTNKFEKVTSKYILSIEDNKVFQTNQNGGVTLIQ